LSRVYSDEKSPYYDFEKAVHWMELTIGDNKSSEQAKIGNMMDLVDLYLTQSKNPLNKQKAREWLQKILPNSKRFKFYKRAQKIFNKLKAESEFSP
jgi:DNA-binding transcriptional regulator YbjK